MSLLFLSFFIYVFIQYCFTFIIIFYKAKFNFVGHKFAQFRLEKIIKFHNKHLSQNNKLSIVKLMMYYICLHSSIISQFFALAL